MNAERVLTIHLHGYWHAGGGRSAGHYLDAMCERDGALPVLPGRQLKGLLRHAVHRAEQWGWLKEFALPEGPASSHETLLFGSASQHEQRDGTHPGGLRVGSARLPAADRYWLQQAEHAHNASALFGELFSTAIDADTGSAKPQSLRGIEAAIPIALHAELELAAVALEPSRHQQQARYVGADTPWQVLQTALPLLDHIGAQRNRGLGECHMQLTTAIPAGA